MPSSDDYISDDRVLVISRLLAGLCLLNAKQRAVRGVGIAEVLKSAKASTWCAGGHTGADKGSGAFVAAAAPPPFSGLRASAPPSVLRSWLQPARPSTVARKGSGALGTPRAHWSLASPPPEHQESLGGCAKLQHRRMREAAALRVVIPADAGDHYCQLLPSLLSLVLQSLLCSASSNPSCYTSFT